MRRPHPFPVVHASELEVIWELSICWRCARAQHGAHTGGFLKSYGVPHDLNDFVCCLYLQSQSFTRRFDKLLFFTCEDGTLVGHASAVFGGSEGCELCFEEAFPRGGRKNLLLYLGR